MALPVMHNDNDKITASHFQRVEITMMGMCI